MRLLLAQGYSMKHAMVILAVLGAAFCLFGSFNGASVTQSGGFYLVLLVVAVVLLFGVGTLIRFAARDQTLRRRGTGR